MAIQPGDPAPYFTLADARSGALITSPWRDGGALLSFFKVTCPVCQATAPKVQAFADAGVRVTAVGEDPAVKLLAYGATFGHDVPTVTEPPPYRVSDAYGITVVPTLVLVGADGIVQSTVVGWDRDRWNAIAESLGAPPVSREGDGLPVFRPG